MNLHGGGANFVATTGVNDIRTRGTAVQTQFMLHDRSGPNVDQLFKLMPWGTSGSPALELDLEPQTEAAEAFLKSMASAPADTIRPQPYPKAYFRCVENVSEAELVSEPLLSKLSVAMASLPTQNNRSRIPVQFTYLGQFIAHDLTRMRQAKASGRFLNQSSHQLDLDTLFDGSPGPCDPAADAFPFGGLKVGRTHPDGSVDDLPRSQADKTPGLPCITDTRNDNNLSLAQLTVAFMKFHQIVCRYCDTGSEEANKDITRRHYQSMVLHDFLTHVVDDDIYADVYSKENPDNRRALFPKLPELFYMPAEFAGACFRFGHSMVRSTYDWNKDHMGEPSANLRYQTHLGDAIRSQLTGRRLVGDWPVDWDIFADGQRSAAIGTAIADDLKELPPRWIDDPPDNSLRFNLAELTLRRGHSLRLPTAAMLRDFLADHLPAGAPELKMLPAEAIIARDHPWVGKHFCEAERAQLCEAAPLWFYVLREAEQPGIDGRHLGPMASRIVMETIHAAICATPNNIITGPKFTADARLPCRPGDPEKFMFKDFIACVRQHAAIFGHS